MTDLPSAPLHAIVRPPETVTETAHVARMLWLRTLFGQSIDDQDEEARPIEPLAHRMTEFFIPRGAALYQEDTMSDSLFFVVEGAVRQGTEGYTLFVPGDVLGFIDAMMVRPHRFSAIVEEDAVILRLRIDDWFEYMEDHFEAVRGLLESTLRNFGEQPDNRKPRTDRQEALSNLSAERSSSSGEFVRRLLALHCCPLLERASIQALSQLVRSSTCHQLETGSRCHSTEEPGIFVVVRGKITLTTTSSEGTHTLVQGPGALVHSLGTLLQIPPTFEVVAQEATELLYVSTRDFFDVLEDHFDVARSALYYLALRLDELNRQRAEGVQRRRPTLPDRPRKRSLRPGA